MRHDAHPDFRRNLDDFTELWHTGPLRLLLHQGANGGVAGEVATGALSIEAMVRMDTLPEPLPVDVDDVTLRAAHLARAEEAVAALEAAGWHLQDPVVRVQWGQAATWPGDDPGGPLRVGDGLDRVTCWLQGRMTR